MGEGDVWEERGNRRRGGDVRCEERVAGEGLERGEEKWEQERGAGKERRSGSKREEQGRREKVEGGGGEER